ncbi:MAG: 3-phosphoshikimate 1-carboxyvinyltransferase [Alicyclobacillaceae bacterium]|jgi:3-phosphoshikimate 1-carboxyvinyltransferase|nr:3-phosphoshikimate 1-carboxyvinyltransferase [Alicyclobacillaceae bacterium]MCY0896459.1 3-phosphoshikimate 1-carboxyvinyltransferase [Alicyclobacillaceae bacterium]
MILHHSESDIVSVSRARQISGTVRVPGDKSITHRAILLGMLAEGRTTVEGWLDAADCRSSIAIAKLLGAQIEVEPDVLHIDGCGGQVTEPSDVLDCGNSGTTMRLFLGAIAGRVPYAVFTGDPSLRSRPMRRVVQPLSAMGASIHQRSNGCAPITVTRSDLESMTYRLPVASAQVKSAILLAGLSTQTGNTVVVEPILTRDHTERLLDGFQAKVNIYEENCERHIAVRGGQTLQGTTVHVPGDVSSAAFLLVAAAIVPGSDLTVVGVGLNETRTGALSVLQRMGADIQLKNVREIAGERIGDIRVRSSSLSGTNIEAEEIPSLVDEIPILSVAAAAAHGTTTVRGAQELRVKETDRITAIVHGLQQLGVDALEQPDGLIIHGNGMIGGGRVDSYHDHRIAMSFAVAALIARHSVEIAHWSAVDISFPTFSTLLKAVADPE